MALKCEKLLFNDIQTISNSFQEFLPNCFLQFQNLIYNKKNCTYTLYDRKRCKSCINKMALNLKHLEDLMNSFCRCHSNTSKEKSVFSALLCTMKKTLHFQNERKTTTIKKRYFLPHVCVIHGFTLLSLFQKNAGKQTPTEKKKQTHSPKVNNPFSDPRPALRGPDMAYIHRERCRESNYILKTKVMSYGTN